MAFSVMLSLATSASSKVTVNPASDSAKKVVSHCPLGGMVAMVRGCHGK